MDFSLTDDQQEIRDLAVRIFGDLSTHERLKEVEATEERFDRKLWGELAAAGLLGLGIPESCGGAGLGFVEACVVAEEAGRSAAAVPLVATTILGAAPIVRFGSPEQQQRWLPKVATGESVLSAGLVEPGADPWSLPTTTADRVGSGWRLRGTKVNVPAGFLADAVVVPARTEGSVSLFVVDLSAPGISVQRQETTSRFDEAEIELQDFELSPDLLLVSGEAGTDAHTWLLERAAAAECVVQAGICEAALKLTASYTSERVQFDKPIATFQAVGQRAADAFIDTEAVR
ncbi:MAG TPA: acyl-CoA dehydrogenase family protein, partial [Acidimicrobiales bacterium]|nr:acyl-CoA dehydrogenase family protein [Acidimicrobiales bacterium]